MNKKISTKILALVTALVLVLGAFAIAAAAEQDTSAVTAAANSVCGVVWGIPNSDNPDILDIWTAGTGFLINKDYVVTADHLFHPGADEIAHIKGIYGANWRSKMVARVYWGGTRYVKATVDDTVRDSGADIAVLKISDSKEIQKEPLKLAKDVGNYISQPASVWALGFDYNENTPDFIQSNSAFSASSVKFQSGNITSKKISGNYNYLETSCDVKHGYSGGPVVDINGAVVGITSWSSGEVKCAAMYTDHLINLLDTVGKGIEYTLINDGGEPGTDDPGTGDPGTGDPGTGDPGTGDPGTGEPVPPEPEVDTAALTAAIASAESKKEENYKSGWAEFSSALDAAKSARDAADSQDAVDQALAALQTATNALVEKPQLNMTLIIAIAAAVVVIVVIVVLIVVLSGKKKKNLALDSNPIPAPNPYGNDPYGQETGPFGGSYQPTPVPDFDPTVSGGAETSVLAGGSEDTSVLSNGSSETTVLSAAPYATLRRRSSGESISVATPTFTIGKERRKTNYCIDNNSTISRRHAQIVKNGANVAVVDLGSTNGTFVNGVRCEANAFVNVKSGDKITFSDEDFDITIL